MSNRSLILDVTRVAPNADTRRFSEFRAMARRLHPPLSATPYRRSLTSVAGHLAALATPGLARSTTVLGEQHTTTDPIRVGAPLLPRKPLGPPIEKVARFNIGMNVKLDMRRCFYTGGHGLPIGNATPSTLGNQSHSQGEVNRIITASKHIYCIHNRDGGATYSLGSGNVAGFPGYAVAIRCFKVVLGRNICAQDIREVIAGNLSILRSSGFYIGTWYDSERDESLIEIVRIVWGIEEAERLALRHGQHSIYDLGESKVIVIVDPAPADPILWPIVCMAAS